jgi:hypothetical protein
MYYVLQCDLPLSSNGEALMEIHNHFRIGSIRFWETGSRHEEQVPVPIQIAYDTFHGYMGPPMEMSDLGIPIMSDRLARAITGAGVSNVDFYDATLTHTQTGQRYAYKAYNLIGLVAAADMAKSAWTSDGDGALINTSFTNLVLDEARCGGLLLFRLAENINAVMVHESVRKHIIASGINTLRFRPPSDWVQI